jgi:hypothetical protein
MASTKNSLITSNTNLNKGKENFNCEAINDSYLSNDRNQLNAEEICLMQDSNSSDLQWCTEGDYDYKR